MEKETYSAQYSFSNYPTKHKKKFTLRGLDVNSSLYSNEFRTRLREELAKTGVNFDGRYSMVAVGMTGWGSNYWIVDRQTGHAYEFPFHAIYLDFEKESNLVIMNPKDKIEELMAVEHGCYYYNQEKVTHLRPFYFLWDSNRLKLLAPTDIAPTVNTFWIDYASDIPDGTPEYLAHFIREAKKRIISVLLKVPQSEGYHGFDLLKVFPGLQPEDFTGVQTPYGAFKVLNSALYFEGNAPFNAAALDMKGWERLLENVGRRMKVERMTKESVEEILRRLGIPTRTRNDE